VLVGEYDDADWARLWLVRLDGSARLVEDPAEVARARSALVAGSNGRADLSLGERLCHC
jgi:hypothetical protein